MTLWGKSASPGVVVGRVLVLAATELKIARTGTHSPDNEVERLQGALAKAKSELSRVRDRAASELGEDKAAIFDAHALVLEDPELIDAAVEKIRSAKVTAEFAFQEVAEQFVAIFAAMKNEYMRERAADIRDVSMRVLRALTGAEQVDLAALTEDVVLVAHDLTPSDTATMNKKHVLGILTDIGGKTSHTAILARTLEIPAVLGLKDATSILKSGDTVAFDGETGEVQPRPDAATLARFEKARADFERTRKEILSFKGLASVTQDGRALRLEGNIGTPEDLGILHKNDAEGVGLYRTEFLFMDRAAMPTEDEQFEAYRQVLASVGAERPTIIRTLDVGGDKEIPYLNIGKEANPFLGLRALRYCLQAPLVFKTQLRALLRASVHGQLGIMFPMVSNVEEVLAAKKMLEEVRAELQAQAVPVAPKVEIGIMIEIPSAAVISDALAKHVDFMSIGTNDLIQYTCAVDRMNERIHDLYDPYHPAVLRLIDLVIRNGHAAGCRVGMCGEMAGSPELIPLLVGMGLKEFSMAPASILRARKIVRSLRAADCQELARGALTLGSGREIEQFLKDRAPIA